MATLLLRLFGLRQGGLDLRELRAEGGRDAFYRGEIADRIVEQVQKDGGVLTHEDLEGYRIR
ncbi:MAG: gamma-glutamyltransferase, partial [Kiritimatiellae bacterium]|nr:gamma-glutamyltransferase [Kiritimatiellia bacterium]